MMTTMTTKKRKTKSRSSFDEAIAHGSAHHERSPHRIHKGKCQIGRPVITDGDTTLEKGELKLSWHPITEEEARKAWKMTGWILD